MVNWLRAWIETIRTMCDRELMRNIRQAKVEYERGETVPWTE